MSDNFAPVGFKEAVQPFCEKMINSEYLPCCRFGVQVSFDELMTSLNVAEKHISSFLKQLHFPNFSQRSVATYTKNTVCHFKSYNYFQKTLWLFVSPTGSSNSKKFGCQHQCLNNNNLPETALILKQQRSICCVQTSLFSSFKFYTQHSCFCRNNIPRLHQKYCCV